MNQKVKKIPQDDFLLKPSSLIYLAGNMPAVQRRAYNALTKEALRSIRSAPETMQVVSELKALRTKIPKGRDEKRMFRVQRNELLEKIPNRFQISARTISKNIGYKYETKEYNKIYNELKKLCNKSREWNLIGRDKEEVHTTIVLLSEITLVEGVGLFEFEIPKTLIEIFLEPRIYARLETIFQNSLTSGYATFWFEMFADYEFKNKELCETPWIEIDLCRKITGVEEGGYKEFKFFKHWVIVKPTQEITEKTCYRTHKILTKKQGRTVTAIKIQYARKPVYQQVLLDVPPKIDEGETQKDTKGEQTRATPEQQEIISDIVDLTGMEKTEAFEVIRDKNLEAVRESLEYVKTKAKSGTIENIGGYARKAVERGWGVKTKHERDQEEKQVAKQKELEEKRVQAKKDDREANKRVELDRERAKASLDIYLKMKPNEKEEIQKKIIARSSKIEIKLMGSGLEKSPLFKGKLAREINDKLPSELQKNDDE